MSTSAPRVEQNSVASIEARSACQALECRGRVSQSTSAAYLEKGVYIHTCSESGPLLHQPWGMGSIFMLLGKLFSRTCFNLRKGRISLRGLGRWVVGLN